MFRLRFACGGSLEIRREDYRAAVEGIERSFGGRLGFFLLQLGVELQDGAVPIPDHDIFILTRPNSAEVGCCSPKTPVTFKEPGKTAFQFSIELPLNSHLKHIKAMLLSTTRSSRRRRNENSVGEEVINRKDGREAYDCTLIIGGKKMSNSYLLGDYLPTKNAMRRTPTILVLWHQLRQEPGTSTTSATGVPRLSLPPAATCSFAATTSAPLPIESQGEGRWGRHLRSRRSVKRQCKGAARFSGLKRGARCGLGIQPLS